MKLIVAKGADYAEAYALRVIQQQVFDLLFFYSDSLHPYFSDTFFTAVRDRGIRIVTFHADDEPEAWYRINEPYDHRFDLVASHSMRGTERRIIAGKEEAYHLPWGYNPALFYPLETAAYEYDVVFIGSNNDFSRPGSKKQEGDGRQDTLSGLYRHCLERGYRFRVFGSGWDRHPLLAEANGGWIDHEKMLSIYHQTKIVFNPGYSAGSSGGHYQTKLRHFEVPGCGALQIVNRNPELADLFVEGQEILFQDAAEDLFGLVDYYLEHEKERKAVAEAGCRKARQSHTTDARIEQLLHWGESLLIDADNPLALVDDVPRDDVVRQVILHDRQALMRWCDRGIEDTRGWFHFVVGSMFCLSSDYSAVLPFLGRSDVPLLGIDSFYEWGMTQHNPMMRKMFHFEGECFGPMVGETGLSDRTSQFVRQRCLSIDDGTRLWPLVNWLVEGTFLEAFIPAVLENDAGIFDKNEWLSTGCLVNDLRDQEVSKRIEPSYLLLLDSLLPILKRIGYRVMIYGARGEMFELVLDRMLAHGYPPTGLIDRALAGQRIRDLPVYSKEQLDALSVNAILVAATTSGPDIVRGLGHYQGRIALLPLHDLRDPVWRVWLGELPHVF